MHNQSNPRNRFHTTPCATLRLGTRGSALALAQTELTKAALATSHPHLIIETVIIQTLGDKNTTQPIAEIGGKAVFTKELDEALLDGRIDAAVHSLKDIPADYPRALTFAAVLPREEAQDVLIAWDKTVQRIEDLPVTAVLGTSSPRRAILARIMNPTIRIEPIRGNVATRLRKIESGEYDATILAKAGLNRLALALGHSIPMEAMIPAVGQGVVAIQCRADDVDTKDIFAAIHHAPTWVAVEAERGLLETLGGTCRSAISAHAHIKGLTLHLSAFVSKHDGSAYDIQHRQGSLQEARALGEALGHYYIQTHGHDFYR